MKRVVAWLHPGRLAFWACLMSLGAGIVPAPALAAFPPATVRAAFFESTLQHNIVNLSVQRGGQTFQVAFLDTYSATGGLTRWGLATSEVIEESEGALVQYYQRGVLEWHSSRTCSPPGSYCMQRKLTWDYFGGDLGAAVDQGVEPNLVNTNPGQRLGPWGHEVSDLSVEGTPTGFLQFFSRLGGVEAFGFPKSDARGDSNQPGMLHIPGATPGFIRQYFQAAVMEYHPDVPSDPIQLRLLGDDLRDLTYPNQAWKFFRSFRGASALSQGAAYDIERVLPGPRRQLATVGFFHSITERCPAMAFAAPDQLWWTPPNEPFCTSGTRFQPVSPGMQIFSGDVVRTRNASPDFDVHALLELARAGVVQAFVVFGTGAQASLGNNAGGADNVRFDSGDGGVVEVPDPGTAFSTPDGDVTDMGTMFLIGVHGAPGTTTTSIKVMEGQLRVRSTRTGGQAIVKAQQEITVTGTGALSGPVSLGPLTAPENARVQYLTQIKSLLGAKAPVQVPPPPSPVG